MYMNVVFNITDNFELITAYSKYKTVLYYILHSGKNPKNVVGIHLALVYNLHLLDE